MLGLVPVKWILRKEPALIGWWTASLLRNTYNILLLIIGKYQSVWCISQRNEYMKCVLYWCFRLLALSCTTENNVEYRHIHLTILEVQQEFLNIPFQCVVLNSVGHDNGTVILIQCELLHTLDNFMSYIHTCLFAKCPSKMLPCPTKDSGKSL